jgi:hypothetical protein
MIVVVIVKYNLIRSQGRQILRLEVFKKLLMLNEPLRDRKSVIRRKKSRAGILATRLTKGGVCLYPESC